MGYLSYELGHPNPGSGTQLPRAVFFQPSTVFAYNPLEGGALHRYGKQEVDPSCEAWDCAENFAVQQSLRSADEYACLVEDIKERIREGDVYQVNLSHPMELASPVDPFTLFCELVERNPAAYMAYVHCGDHVVISSSPECLLSKRGRNVETRPIKGTRARGKTADEDVLQRQELLNSAKDRAELTMITDLMRNDLNKVCSVGSVRVDELYRCEAYTNVFHLLSVVRGELDVDQDVWTVLEALFPGGSITGCPKRAAMDVITELEQGARGVYTGSIGWIGGQGDCDFNIAIRTLLWRQGSYRMQVGGAVVIDSDPQEEYVETLDKGQTMFAALGWHP
jgi:para-aminobenzoate synthetase component 1